jgi:ATP-dependent DNA ligase
MLARSGRLPMSGDYAYEVKWDGFRALVGSGAAYAFAAAGDGT